MTRRRLFDGQGYFLNDNTCSGGLRIEDDLINCRHCQRSMLRCDWVQEGGFCHRCDAPICSTCADPRLTGECKPIQQQIDEVLNARYHREQNARLLGI
jgi:hypothetical protein